MVIIMPLQRRLGPMHTIRGMSRSASHVHEHLRALLRETAQPVAVVTSLMPNARDASSPPFHGATLSSFSSIAMDPHPLVAFSLRIPSRMATSLKNAHVDLPSHMVINVLSAQQADVAVKFSRVDLHPRPFDSTPHFLTEEGLPVIEGSLGALSCKLIASSWPLHDLGLLRSRDAGREANWNGAGIASELFIAQVVRVEALRNPEEQEESLRTLPLLYHRRGYATVCDTPNRPIDPKS